MSDWRRHAIYFAPAAGSALARFGAEWFGSDPESGEARDGPVLSNLAARRTVLTASLCTAVTRIHLAVGLSKVANMPNPPPFHGLIVPRWAVSI
jgi:hypothetical protein